MDGKWRNDYRSRFKTKASRIATKNQFELIKMLSEGRPILRRDPVVINSVFCFLNRPIIGWWLKIKANMTQSGRLFLISKLRCVNARNYYRRLGCLRGSWKLWKLWLTFRRSSKISSWHSLAHLIPFKPWHVFTYDVTDSRTGKGEGRNRHADTRTRHWSVFGHLKKIDLRS